MKITKQRLKEIIKEELNEASNPEWESADKILRGLVYLAQDLLSRIHDYDGRVIL